MAIENLRPADPFFRDPPDGRTSVPSNRPDGRTPVASNRPDGRTPVSPRARRLAVEAGRDLAGVAGSGPHGRIVERDVRAALAAQPPRLAADVVDPLLRVTNGAPQAHLEADCALDALEKLRNRLNDAERDETAAKISLVDCVVKALATALRQVPRANILQTQDGFVPSSQCTIAMVMAVEGRIATPALAAAESRTLAEIAASREKFMTGRFAEADPAEKANVGTGSCLVIDFGDFGVKRVFPVIVAPWTLVLSIGEARDRVVVEDGAPRVVAMLSVTLTIDRRAMDEIAGAMLLDAFRQAIENPYRLL